MSSAGSRSPSTAQPLSRSGTRVAAWTPTLSTRRQEGASWREVPRRGCGCPSGGGWRGGKPELRAKARGGERARGSVRLSVSDSARASRPGEPGKRSDVRRSWSSEGCWPGGEGVTCRGGGRGLGRGWLGLVAAGWHARVRPTAASRPWAERSKLGVGRGRGKESDGKKRVEDAAVGLLAASLGWLGSNDRLGALGLGLAATGQATAAAASGPKPAGVQSGAGKFRPPLLCTRRGRRVAEPVGPLPSPCAASAWPVPEARLRPTNDGATSTSGCRRPLLGLVESCGPPAGGWEGAPSPYPAQDGRRKQLITPRSLFGRKPLHHARLGCSLLTIAAGPRSR
jgi:hypothetical protein